MTAAPPSALTVLDIILDDDEEVVLVPQLENPLPRPDRRRPEPDRAKGQAGPHPLARDVVPGEYLVDQFLNRFDYACQCRRACRRA